MNYIEEIQAYLPKNEQEYNDKRILLNYIKDFPDTILTRLNDYAHITSSSMIFNTAQDKILMVYHNIYKSWSWTGGHADGDSNLLAVAIKEAQEETGVTKILPISTTIAAIDILPVWGHKKRGQFVSCHLHLNISYLLTASESEQLIVKEDENSDVMWIDIKDLEHYVSESAMIPVYQKLICSLKTA